METQRGSELRKLMTAELDIDSKFDQTKAEAFPQTAWFLISIHYPQIKYLGCLCHRHCGFRVNHPFSNLLGAHEVGEWFGNVWLRIFSGETGSVSNALLFTEI